MKTLVIAEKPSVARDIARVLGCSKKENGALMKFNAPFFLSGPD